MNENVTLLFCQAMESGRSAAVATVIASEGSSPRDAGAKMIVYGDGGTAGTVGGGRLEALTIKECLSAIEAGKPRKAVFDLEPDGAGMICRGRVEVFIEVHVRGLQVVILGAGHVGEAVAAVCATAGLPCVVADERAEFANELRFPRAARIILAEPHRAVGQAGIDDRTYVVIVTRGHEIDRRCLRAALKTPARYIGMIGSKSKVVETVAGLRKKGCRADDPRVFSPIGLDLGGKSPGEIAVSVVAEILKVRYGRSGGHLRLASR